MLWIAGLFGVFLLGIPISFSLGATTLAGLLGMGLPLEVIVQRMFTGIDNFAFVAIPLFILAGNLMAVGGISKRITTFSEALVGHWPGGLGMVAIVASMIFAAVTGSAIAATAAIGALLISEIISKGYSRAYSASWWPRRIHRAHHPAEHPWWCTRHRGQLHREAVMGGVIPGLLMGFFLMVANWLISKRRGYVGREKRASAAEPARASRMPSSPSHAVIIIGGIVGGIFPHRVGCHRGSLTPFSSLAGLPGTDLEKGGPRLYRGGHNQRGHSHVLMTASLLSGHDGEDDPQSITQSLLQVIDTKWGALMVMNIIRSSPELHRQPPAPSPFFVPLFLPLV